MTPAAFCCPVCGGALTHKGSALCCVKGHSFDVAKEGHVNLLMASRMHAKLPGDNKDMVNARHRLLQSGAYDGFANALAALCCQMPKNGDALRILDAGCGEGYYDAAVCAALKQAGQSYRLAGFDISKAAVCLAAKRKLADAQFAVASSFAIPLPSGWADVLLNVFSPFAHQEFLRVLAPGGRLVYAVPTPRHLLGLKQVLYATPYENPLQDTAYSGFQLVEEKTVETEVLLKGGLVQDLFAMTPYYWKTPLEGVKRLQQLQTLETPIGFRFLVFEKQGLR